MGDLLFNTVEVRELLPGGDNNNAEGGSESPLAVPDLRLLIQSLHQRTHFLKSQALGYLQSHRLPFLHLFSTSSHSLSLSHHASILLHRLLSLLSSRSSSLSHAHSSLSLLTSTTLLLSQKTTLLHSLRTISSLHNTLSSLPALFNSGLLLESVEEMMALKNDLRLAQIEDGEPVVFSLLRDLWRRRFEEIKCLLVRCMKEAVLFDAKHGRVLVRYGFGVDVVRRVELRVVLDAIRVAGVIEIGFLDAVDVVIEHVVTPVVGYGSSVTFVEHDAAFLKDEVALDVSSVSDEPFHGGDVGCEVVYSSLLHVVRFVCDFVCFQNVECVRAFGDLAWPRMKGLIISELFSKVSLDDDIELTGFQRIVEQTCEFESVLRDVMFISDCESRENGLSGFLQSMVGRFASRKKSEVLAEARGLIMDCDFGIPSEDARNSPSRTVLNGEGEDSIEGGLVISEAASRLVELVHRTLKDSCSSSEAVGYQLYYAARDALILYEAIVPVKLEMLLKGVNHVAVLVHNDCMFIYREVLRLALQYRPFLPNLLKENASFADIGPRFLVLGDAVLFAQIKVIVFNLNEVVDAAEGFQNTQLTQDYESVKFSIDQVCFLLEKVHILWEPLLRPSTYRRNMSAILESLFGRVVIDILLLDDIGAEETLQIQKLIVWMLENTDSLVESLIHPKRVVAAPPVSVSESIPSLIKLRKLSELLDMPMKSITGEWESGELVKCGFTAEEVENFIKSTFTDTSFRKECIGRIRSTKTT